MANLLARLGAAAGALALGAGAVLVPAFAEEVATGVTMDQEAWYYAPPTQHAFDTLRGFLPEVPEPPPQLTEGTNPYITDTLHVGVRAGLPEAVAFVSFPLEALAPTGSVAVTGGTLTLTESGLHEQRAADAEIVACLTLQPITPEQAGSWDELPAFDCNLRSPAVLVEGSDPLTWEVDLAPFAGAWSLPAENFGVALAPHPASDTPEPLQTWHVAFHSSAYEPLTPAEPEPAPITADLHYVAETVEPPALVEADDLVSAPPAPVEAPGFAPVRPGAAEVTLPDAEAAGPGPEEPDAAPADVDDELPVARQVPLQPAAQTDPSGPLSLLALLCAGVFGYALTNEGSLRLSRRQPDAGTG